MRSFLLLALPTWLALNQLAWCQDPMCYYPNGKNDTGLTACNASAAVSHCCQATDLCLSNGYCFTQSETYGNRLARQGCTDQSWESSSCPQYCISSYTNQELSIGLARDYPDGTFCCMGGDGYNNTADTCAAETNGSNKPFNLAQGLIIYDRATGSTLPNGTSTALNGTVTGMPNSLPSVTSSSNSNNAVAIGAGVGASLGLLFLLASASSVYLWRKNNQLSRELRHAKEELRAQGVQQVPLLNRAPTPNEEIKTNAYRAAELDEMGPRIAELGPSS